MEPAPILIVSATRFETAPLRAALSQRFASCATAVGEGYRCPHTGRSVIFFSTGVGVPETLLSLAPYVHTLQPGFVLQMGIAGSFDRSLALGQVVEVISECYADLGAEDRDGRFLDLYTLGLDDPNRFPFTKGKLLNPKPLALEGTIPVSGLTANTASGQAPRIAALVERCPVQVESMEGAAVFDCCLRMGWSFAQVRGLSNYVEPRDRTQWQIALAVSRVNAVVERWINAV
jgi:futalosine hydrolase